MIMILISVILIRRHALGEFRLDVYDVYFLFVYLIYLLKKFCSQVTATPQRHSRETETSHSFRRLISLFYKYDIFSIDIFLINY